MVGYTGTIHRAAHEGKRQAMASVEARSMLERIRDYPVAFKQALLPEGLEDTRSEYLLSGESDESDNEQGRMSAASFHLVGKAALISGNVYSVVVSAEWTEDGRERKVVLESRMIPIGE